MTRVTASRNIAGMSKPVSVPDLIAEHGGLTAFARAVGHKVSTVQYWRDKSKRIPAEAVPAVERATGVPRTRLRPDIYGDAA